MSILADSASRFSPEQARAAARDFDLKRLPADFIDDPFPYYGALREHDPVHRMPDGAVLPDHALARLRCGLSRRAHLLLRQEDRVSAEIRRHAALPASHHQPRVQRSAAAHPCAPRDRRWRCQTAWSPGWRRGWSRWSTGCSTRWRKGPRRPDRGFRRRHSGRDHRQPARRPHADRAPLRGWSLAILGALEPVLTRNSRRSAITRCATSRLSQGLIEERRRKPGDPEKDLLTRLIAGEHEGRR